MNVFNFVCVSFFPFGIEDVIRAVIVLIPDHCISIYFVLQVSTTLLQRYSVVLAVQCSSCFISAFNPGIDIHYFLFGSFDVSKEHMFIMNHNRS